MKAMKAMRKQAMKAKAAKRAMTPVEAFVTAKEKAKKAAIKKAKKAANPADGLLFNCMKSLKVCQWVLCDIHSHGVKVWAPYVMTPNMKAMKRAMKAKATAPATAMKAMKK